MTVKRNASDPEACSNCGQPIGKLETPYLWGQRVVCRDCYKKLSLARAHESPIELDYAGIAEEADDMKALAASTPARRGCPVCGSLKRPIKRSRGSCLVLLFLAMFFVPAIYLGSCLGLLFVLPAIFYAIFWSGHVWVCPDCGSRIGQIH